jgi:hypothetical protein
MKSKIFGLYVAWLAVAAMLVYAVIEKHPYSYYPLLRWVCCPVFAFSAVSTFQMNRVAWTWTFGVLAGLYNPIFRVHLDRNIWIGVNLFTIGAIVIAAVVFWRSKESTVSLSEDKIEILHVSRRAVAREWLIFLAVLPLGFATCFLDWAASRYSPSGEGSLMANKSRPDKDAPRDRQDKFWLFLCHRV